MQRCFTPYITPTVSLGSLMNKKELFNSTKKEIPHYKLRTCHEVCKDIQNKNAMGLNAE